MNTLADPALLVALMLLAGIIGGYAGSAARVPRVVGYLVGGMLLSFLLHFIEGRLDSPHTAHLSAAATQLGGIRTIALGLIMFSIGNVFEAKHFHAVAHKVLRLSFTKLVCVLILVGAGTIIIALAQQNFTSSAAGAFGILLGVVGIATAPAATLLVLREYEAKGPNSDTILTLTALNNLTCIVLFHVAFMLLSGLGWIDSTYSTGRWLGLDLLLTSVGSIALGVALGFLLSVIYVRMTIADFMLVFLGVLVVLGTFRETLSGTCHLSYSFLLVCLFVGSTFANITPDQQPFHNALRTISTPIFVLFFVIAGFNLHLGNLLHLGALGAAYIILRSAGKIIGGRLGIRWLHDPDYSHNLGAGMLCQAGVAIGLAAFVHSTWGTVQDGQFVPHPAAEALHAVILGSVVIFELLGPIALKQVVVSAGEVKALTLLRRRRTPGHETTSVFQQAWEALLQTLHASGRQPPPPSQPLQARHIMRANVKLLPASARFDEVLHFMEHSHHNHFPVVGDDGAYVGMIHYSDLRHIIYSPQIRNLVTATDLARPDSPAVLRDTPLKELFEIFHDSDHGSIAVLESRDSRRVVGIVEQRDLLLAVRADQAREDNAPRT